MTSVPSLRVYEVLDGFEDVWHPSLCNLAYTDATLSQALLENIPSLKKLDTIIIRPNVGKNSAVQEATVVKCVTALKSLPPVPEKRRLFIAHEVVYFTTTWRNRERRHLTGGLTEVDLS